jgi:hypothetical protein
MQSIRSSVKKFFKAAAPRGRHARTANLNARNVSAKRSDPRVKSNAARRASVQAFNGPRPTKVEASPTKSVRFADDNRRKLGTRDAKHVQRVKSKPRSKSELAACCDGAARTSHAEDSTNLNSDRAAEEARGSDSARAKGAVASAEDVLEYELEERPQVRELERQPLEERSSPLACQLADLNQLIMELHGSIEDSASLQPDQVGEESRGDQPQKTVTFATHAEELSIIGESPEVRELERKSPPYVVFRELLRKIQKKTPEIAAMIDRIADNDEWFDRLLELWQRSADRGQEQLFVELLRGAAKHWSSKSPEYCSPDTRAATAIS